MNKTYLCIDLKSFYASVECIKRGLDPMTSNLVVADTSRTDRTICLAVSPSLRKLGVKNRCRLFEIPAGLHYITAVPRMRLYMETAAEIYEIYLRYVSPADIHVYSIDEAFLDVTEYLPLYKKTPREMAEMLLGCIYAELGLTAACGIGGNIYLSKVALDILAKHSPGFIAYLDEERYRSLLWRHTPITDFWMIASGVSRRLQKLGIRCMEHLAEAPEALIMQNFGKNGEALIDRAWGRDATTIENIKQYVPKQHSLSHSQVIGTACSRKRGLILLRDMADSLCLDMAEHDLKAGSLSMYISGRAGAGEPLRISVSRVMDAENRYSVIKEKIDRLYEENVPRSISDIHRAGISFGSLGPAAVENTLFADTAAEKERDLQKTICGLKRRYGSAAILRGSCWLPGSTARERRGQIGGHRS
ncbi:MAG: DNA repair protein [Abditibacteriota bacterium]|nr:DNA repair protein [Abditibacteriota bacterium]